MRCSQVIEELTKGGLLCSNIARIGNKDTIALSFLGHTHTPLHLHLKIYLVISLSEGHADLSDP